jgi:hypothetical protein
VLEIVHAFEKASGKVLPDLIYTYITKTFRAVRTRYSYYRLLARGSSDVPNSTIELLTCGTRQAWVPHVSERKSGTAGYARQRIHVPYLCMAWTIARYSY